MKLQLTILLLLVLALVPRVYAQDKSQRIAAVGFPLSAAQNIAAGKSLTGNFEFRITLSRDSNGQPYMGALAFDATTKTTLATLVNNTWGIVVDDTPRIKGTLTTRDELIIYTKAGGTSNGNMAFVFTEYFEGQKFKVLRIAYWDPATDHELYVFTAGPMPELFPETGGNPLPYISSVVSQADKLGLIQHKKAVNP